MEAPPPRKRGPYAKTRLRRDDIARATLALVRLHGHRGVTTGAVAARADVTEATVLYHFPTRDLLLVAAIEAWAAEDSMDLGEAHVDVAEEIGRAAHGGAEDAHRLRLFVYLAAEASSPEHPAHEWLINHHRASRDFFASALRARQATGEAHPDLDPERFARQMVAAWDGLQSQWLANPDFNLADEVTAAFRSLSRQDVMAARRAIEQLASTM